ncbi:MAG: hypothetical protein QXQ47_06805 [Candidatus Bathyarchaeia archaeon]
MAVDRWAWDKAHIKRYREVHEPYDSYEQLMIEKAASNPFWIEMWGSQGNVTKHVLPSGLTVLTKSSQGKFEQYVLTDSGEVLDFWHEPKDYQVKKPLVVTPELIVRAECKLAELRGRRKRRNG